MNWQTRLAGAILIFLVGAVLSGVGALFLHQATYREARAEFQRMFDDRVTVVAFTLKQRIDTLRAITGLFEASQQVTRHEFGVFTSSLVGELPGIQAFAWNPRITDTERPDFEAQGAAEIPGFRVAERDARGHMAPASRRDEYYPVFFVEPLSRNKTSLGFDIGSNPARLKALQDARDSGEVRASGRIILVQEEGGKPGFLVLRPVYAEGGVPESITERRRNLRGFVLGAFRVADVLDSGMDWLDPGGISFEVVDVTDPGAPEILHRHVSRRLSGTTFEEAVASENAFRGMETISVAGRAWTIVGYGDGRFFYRANRHWQPWGLFAAGLAISSLLGLFFLVLMRSSGEVRQLVAERTRELSESRGHLKGIFDTVADGIVVVDERGIIQSVNPAVYAIFGCPPGELVGRNVSVFAASPYHEEHDAYIAAYLRTGEKKIIGKRREVEGRRWDGSLFPVELTVTELEAGPERRFLGVMRDISDRKAAEQAKDQFVATVSHELRSPLTVILGYLPLLKDSDALPDAATVSAIAAKMEKSGEHLLEMVTDLLDFSRIKVGGLELAFEDVDAAEAVRGVASEFEGACRDKGLTLDILAEPCRVRGDPGRLRQILVNLVTNAMKFTAEGGIAIGLREDAAAGVAVFSVTDTGCGIPEDRLAEVFERFRQIDNSSTRRIGGAGLGLAIVKDLVGLHGGEVWAESVPGRGSTFTFTVPLAIESENGHGDDSAG